MSKALVRWAGSKRRLVKSIARHVPCSVFPYIEPFAGSAALFFHLRPALGILGDVNPHLTTLFKCLRTDPERVYQAYSRRSPAESAYYSARRKFNDLAKVPGTPAQFERAGLMLYLNRLCFNGIYRVNSRGEYNVPFGGVRLSKPLTRNDLLDAGRALQSAVIVTGDFEATVRMSVIKGSFVYIDPPYFSSKTRIFGDYDSVVFSSEDLKRLDSLLNYIDKKGAFFLLSYAHLPEVKYLADRWHHGLMSTVRHVAGFRSRKRVDTELILSNFPLIRNVDE